MVGDRLHLGLPKTQWLGIKLRKELPDWQRKGETLFLGDPNESPL